MRKLRETAQAGLEKPGFSRKPGLKPGPGLFLTSPEKCVPGPARLKIWSPGLRYHERGRLSPKYGSEKR